MQLQQIWEENPTLFNEFVRKWANNPRNQQQIVEMLDGKPQGSSGDTHIGDNIINITPEHQAEYDLIKELERVVINKYGSLESGIKEMDDD